MPRSTSCWTVTERAARNWCSPRRASGIADLDIVVDGRERYPYRFSTQQVNVEKRSLPCGDYGLILDERLVAAVERKSLGDLVTSLTNGTLRYALGELAALPRAAVVVEDRYSEIFKLDRMRPADVADGLAELQVRWSEVPIVFCENRQLAEEWTYRYLAAARQWADTERDALPRIVPAADSETSGAPAAPEPSTAEVRAWAMNQGLPVSDRGRLRPEVWQAWRDAHQ
ncbi:ERCC4 domain-containing protein [Haloechinothrix halophila]|uniref:ERCC4 domain-containing protein n=1 Tax=Haloechinothrix halophila TaxID=1069073 RepID=UPI0018C895FF|nr:histone-like nucleoid-structuring protein Lsr2 [Haloechinothrix halophila]